MATFLPRTSERLVPEHVASRDGYLLYLRHVFAYDLAAGMVEPGAAVLDMGCGEGYGTARLAARGAEAVGVDVSPEVIGHAGAKYGSDGCRFQVYDGRELPFPDGAFDMVTSFQVLEHVQDDEGYAAEVARMLRAGGRLVLVTPNAATRLEPGERPWNRFHLREYTRDDLGGLLEGKFAEVTLAGVTAVPEVYEMEMARVRQSRRIVAADPLNVRRLIPEGLKPWATRVARRLFPRRQADAPADDWQERYGPDAYRLAEDPDEVARSLDLVAVCRR